MDSSNGKRSGAYDLGCALAQLAVLGHGVDLTRWDGVFAARLGGGAAVAASGKPAMAVMLTGANYVKPRAMRPAVSVVMVAAACVGRWARRVPEVPVKEGTSLLSDKSDVKKVEAAAANGRGAAQHGNGASGMLSGIPDPGERAEKLSAPLSMAHGVQAGSAMAQALAATQAGILALQKMQEQTAVLHAQYLRGQEAAQGTIAELMRQQMALLTGGVLPMGAVAANGSGASGMLRGHSDLGQRTGNQSAPLSMAHVAPVVSQWRRWWLCRRCAEVVAGSPVVAVEGPVPKVVAPGADW